MIKKISEFVAKYFSMLETLFILALTTCLLMFTFGLTKAIYGVWTSLGLMALLYFLMMLRPFDKDKRVAGIRIAIRRVVYMSYIFSTLTFLSALRFNDDVDSKGLAITSLCFLGVAVVLLLLKRFKMNEKPEFAPNIIRCSVFAIVMVWLLIMYA